MRQLDYNPAPRRTDFAPFGMLRSHRLLESLACACMLALPSVSLAQNIAGVFPPGFGEEHRSAQYRITYEADSHATVHRFHYQESIDAQRLWRVIVQANKTDDSDVDADFVSGEFFWQLSPASARWQQGLRFDAVVRTEGRPGVAAANWVGQYRAADRWRLRANLLTAAEIGDGRQGGVFVQTRAQLDFAFAPGQSLGLEHYGVYGSSKDFNGLKQQGHQLGPYVDLPLAGGWRLFGSALFGLTDASQDLDLKLWVTRLF